MATPQKTEPLPPAPECGTGLTAALKLRRSTREYDASREISPEVLSALLWAAAGVTGPEGKRTAPSAFGGNQVSVCVALASGVARYDAAAHSLVEISQDDIRRSLCPEDWVGAAPLDLILTGAVDRFPDFVSEAMGPELLQATAGCIAENVHLMAAALGLGTCMVGHMNSDEISKALRLPPTEVPLYVMPTGYLRLN